MAQTKVKLVSNGVITVDNLHTNHGITTDHIGEGSVLYYTDARVQSFLTTNNYITNSDVADLETLTSLSLAANTLSYVDEAGNTTNLDLSLYLDDTNLARLVSGSLDGQTGIATFTRDDASTFTIDFSSLTPSETDPVFTASAASGITLTNISNWDTAYGWGDHSSAGYLTSLPSHTHVWTDITDRPTALSSFTNDAGFITSFTETDPIYTASSWYTTTNNSSNWNTAYGWGNHASAGYLTSFTESDPTVPSHVKSITTTNISNWDTAYGWGNHASAGYLTSLPSHTHDYVPERGRTDWNDGTVIDDVVGQLGWWNYGNSHTIFDASKSIAPGGTAKNNTNPDVTWAATYPTLMGWNGVNTYGVRVDSSRFADYAGAPTSPDFIASGSLRAPIFYDSNDTGYYVDPNSTSRLNNISSFILRNNYDVSSDHSYGMYFSNGESKSYAIYRESGAWSHPYPDLVIGFHTGIKIGGYFGYNGTRFYNNSPNDTTTIIASIGDGDNNLRGYYDIIAYASDKRLKENIQPIENALNKVMSLNGFTYNWNTIGEQYGWEPPKEREAGVFAQEVQKVLPEAVRIAPFDQDHDVEGNMYSKSGENYLTVQYEKIVPLLIEAIKEQQQQIEELKALINK